MIIDPAISLSLALALAALLAGAGAHKLRDFRRFVGVLRNYRVLPDAAAPAAAAGAVAAEFAIAAALLAPALRTEGAFGAAILFAVYGAAIGFNIARGRTSIDCGCSFGEGDGEPLSQRLLWRNGALSIAALVVAAPAGARALLWLDWATAVLFVGGAAVIYLGMETLAATQAAARGVRRI